MTKEEFLKDVQNWDNHRYLLWPALEATKGLVVEFGIGHGSTPYLSGYTQSRARHLVSYENNKEWFDKFNGNFVHEINLVKDWDLVVLPFEVDVILIDHAPGERRKIDIAKYSHKAKIIVAHDTEPAADHGYQMRAELKKFKYAVEYESQGAWASMVSNFIDVKKLLF